MSIERRTFLAGSMGAVLGARAVQAFQTGTAAQKPLKAILFDAFPLFDPRIVGSIAERLYREKAGVLMQAWRTRQFEYQ